MVLLWFGIGNFMGQLSGGAFGRYLYQIHPSYPSLLAGIMAIVGCIPFWFLLNGVDASTGWVTMVVVTFLAGLGSGVTGPIVKATLQNVTLPTTRGQAFALLNTFDDVGRGLGPVVLALLIVRMGERRAAFNIGVLGWVFCGLANLATYWTVARDENRVQAVFAASLESSGLRGKRE